VLFPQWRALVDGDGKMLATVAGFAVGVFCFVTLAERQWLPRPSPTPALLGPLLAWAMLPAFVFLAWVVYEGVRLWRTRETNAGLIDRLLAPRYRLSTAALLIGLSGAFLLLLYGAYGYTATLELVIEGALGTAGWPPTVRWVLLIAMLM
jgi:hypothetical protein